VLNRFNCNAGSSALCVHTYIMHRHSPQRSNETVAFRTIAKCVSPVSGTFPSAAEHFLRSARDGGRAREATLRRTAPGTDQP